MAGTDNGHRSDEITSYLSDALEPEAKTTFEAHLATCEECQRELKAQRALFSRTDEALAFKGKRTIDEQVARFEREVAAERQGARGAPRRARRWVGPAAVAVLAAASASGIFVVLGKPGGGVGSNPTAQKAVDAGTQERVLAAPQRPEVDGGLDGGGE